MDGAFVLTILIYISFFTGGICAAVAGYNAKKKGHSYIAYYFLGLFLGIIGLIISLVIREKEKNEGSEISALLYYKNLLDAGLITQQVYLFKRDRVMNYLGGFLNYQIEDEGQKRTVIWMSAITAIFGLALFMTQLICLLICNRAVARSAESITFIRVAFFVAMIAALLMVIVGCIGLYAISKDKLATSAENAGMASLAASCLLIVASLASGILAYIASGLCLINFGVTGSLFVSLALVLYINLFGGSLVSVFAFNSGLYATLFYKTIAAAYAEQAYTEWPQFPTPQNATYRNYSQYQPPQTIYPRNPYGW